ncbi:hypothetical protein NRB56_68310 [Nocardia sp. RB56]|uniref:Uncharacterized protein n=1 Tax=Nocardia aurantia TaxID=2585199 RepID=A0A7K0DZI5_9NOCA|nr:hypothetical protein [Nocardia aurantia]
MSQAVGARGSAAAAESAAANVRRMRWRGYREPTSKEFRTVSVRVTRSLSPEAAGSVTVGGTIR